MNDFKQTEAGDLDFSSGDLQIIESSSQHQRDILSARKGEFKHAPAVGVNIDDYLNEERPQSLMREVRRQFSADGMRINSISFENGQLLIDAYYG
jgi:hypothetical protein